MGTNAAVICRKVIENAFEVLTIEAITIVQAIEYLGFQDKVSSATKELYDEIRKIIPAFSDDMVMYPYLEEVKKYLKAM
jgi:histidine ammonia-lyase